MSENIFHESARRVMADAVDARRSMVGSVEDLLAEIERLKAEIRRQDDVIYAAYEQLRHRAVAEKTEQGEDPWLTSRTTRNVPSRH